MGLSRHIGVGWEHFFGRRRILCEPLSSTGTHRGCDGENDVMIHENPSSDERNIGALPIQARFFTVFVFDSGAQYPSTRPLVVYILCLSLLCARVVCCFVVVGGGWLAMLGNRGGGRWWWVDGRISMSLSLVVWDVWAHVIRVLFVDDGEWSG